MPCIEVADHDPKRGELLNVIVYTEVEAVLVVENGVKELVGSDGIARLDEENGTVTIAERSGTTLLVASDMIIDGCEAFTVATKTFVARVGVTRNA